MLDADDLDTGEAENARRCLRKYLLERRGLTEANFLVVSAQLVFEKAALRNL